MATYGHIGPKRWKFDRLKLTMDVCVYAEPFELWSTSRPNISHSLRVVLKVLSPQNLHVTYIKSLVLTSKICRQLKVTNIKVHLGLGVLTQGPIRLSAQLWCNKGKCAIKARVLLGFTSSLLSSYFTIYIHIKWCHRHPKFFTKIKSPTSLQSCILKHLI